MAPETQRPFVDCRLGYFSKFSRDLGVKARTSNTSTSYSPPDYRKMKTKLSPEQVRMTFLYNLHDCHPVILQSYVFYSSLHCLGVPSLPGTCSEGLSREMLRPKEPGPQSNLHLKDGHRVPTHTKMKKLGEAQPEPWDVWPLGQLSGGSCKEG